MTSKALTMALTRLLGLDSGPSTGVEGIYRVYVWYVRILGFITRGP